MMLLPYPWKMAHYVSFLITLVSLCYLCQGQTGNILQYRVFEEEAANKFVGNVKLDSKLDQRYSVEVLSKLEFNFRYANGDYSLFTIDLRMGIIRTSRSIDREQICEYQDTCDIDLDIKVTPVQYFEIIKVKVNIMDTNDNLPTFPQQQISTSIAETTMSGALIPIPSADDKDSGKYGIEGYRMDTQNQANGNFDLQVTEHSDGSMDINIVLLSKLDREQTAFYTLIVYAYDGDTPQHSGSITVDVTVTDANDNPPKFDNSSYETTIFENLPFRTTILQVHAVDKDSGLFGEVVYSLAPSTISEYGSLFGINNRSGEIYVKGLIDYEVSQMYQLNVQAQDKGPNSLPTFAKVKIHVLDLNDHAPQINVNVLTTSGNAEVLENADKGTFVAHVSVMDPDLGVSGLFDCEIDNDAFQLLSLPGSTMEYKIVSRKVFDREDQTQYHIVMTCEDKGTPLQTAVEQIVVNVLDENDHDPVFSTGHYHTTIAENNSLNAYIIKIDAEDKDAGPNAAIKYSIQGATDNSVVIIDAISGVIKANSVFDYEVKSNYEFEIVASDHGDPERSSTVMFSLAIEDVNDQYPVFSKEICFLKPKEGQPKDLKVGKVNATDADSRKYNNITYSINPKKAGSENFYINAQTGEIFTRGSLDRERQEVYHLEIIAANYGYPTIQSKKECTVHVLDINDNPPVIYFPSKKNKTIEISNQAPIDYLVTKVQASDPDSDENGKISYHISKQSVGSYFKINEQSGDVSVAESLETIDRQVIKIDVTVVDKGKPPRSKKEGLNIVVDKRVASPLAQSGSFIQKNLMVILGALLGLIFIIVIITVLLCAVKYRNRRAADKGAKYNCRLAANKSLNGGVKGNGGGDMKNYDGDSVSMKSDCSMDSPTKESKSLKKEVTFTFDHDEAYMQKSPGGRTLTQETCLSQGSPSPQFLSPIKQPRPRPPGDLSPHRSRSPESNNNSGSGGGTPSPVNHPPAVVPVHRPVINKYPHITDPRKYSHHPLGLRHYDRSPTHPGHTTLQPNNNSKKLTERSLEMHDILNLSNHTDMDSECSGTDSGRGPSEEGEYLMLYPNANHPVSSQPQYTNPQYRIDPYYSGESRNVNVSKDKQKVHQSTNEKSSPSKSADNIRNSTGRYSQREPKRFLDTPQRASMRESPLKLSSSSSKSSSSNPIIKPEPLRLHLQNGGSSPTKPYPSVSNVSPVKGPVVTADSNCDVQTPSKIWDPLNHHTQRKPKELDARDLIPLQNEYIYKAGCVGDTTNRLGSGGGGAGQKNPPPLPPKRTPGITISSQNPVNINKEEDDDSGNNQGVQDSQLQSSCVRRNSDHNGNYGNNKHVNSVTGGRYGNNSMYDVPANAKMFNNDSSFPSKHHNGMDNTALLNSNVINTYRNEPSNNSVINQSDIPLNQLPSSLKTVDQFVRKDNTNIGQKKEVRFAEDFDASQKMGITNNLETCSSSNEGLSDDETCTSGSYILDPGAVLHEGGENGRPLQQQQQQRVYNDIEIDPHSYSVV